MSAGLEAALARLWWREDRGAMAWLLWPPSLLYGVVMALRRWAFAIGWRRSGRAPVPVIVVGNLVVGGAGKTPTVIALVQALRAAGWSPGVVSRGHGRRVALTLAVDDAGRAADTGDEPLLIRRRTQVPVWVGRRRLEAARALCSAHPEVNVLVADDGLQHLALAREVQVIVFDERGIGNGLLLPAGPLRQSLPRFVPVNSHVLYNAEQPTTRWPGALAQRRLGGAVLLQDWWQGAEASPQALQALRGRPLLAAAGMASPQRFFDMLRSAGLDFEVLALPDHHDFAHAPWPAGTADVLVTEKDAVKLMPAAAGATRIWVVPLDFQLPPDFQAAVLDNLRLNRRP